MRGLQQTVPDLQELRRLWAEHDSIEDFNEQVMHDPPTINIPRSCQCGRSLPALKIGWGEIASRVEHGKPLPEHLEQRQCDHCAPEEEEED